MLSSFVLTSAGKITRQMGPGDYARGHEMLRLGKAPEQIVVGEVVRTMEPDFAVVECEDPTGYCKIAPCCALRSAMRKAVQAFLTKLDEYTLEDLFRPKSRLRVLLGVEQKPAVLRIGKDSKKRKFRTEMPESCLQKGKKC